MQTIIVNNFPGMVADPRNTRGSQLCKHFDNFTTKSLVPYKSTETAYASQSTAKIEKMLMYNSKMYGYGVKSSGGYAKVFENSNLSVPNWSASTGGEDSADTPDFGLFIEYKGVIYGAATNRIWSYNIGSTAFSGTTGGGGISFTNIAQGLVKADKLYIPIDNKIYYKDGSSSIALGIALPADIIISSICEYGNYIAIACRPLFQDSRNSTVYLWDRDITLVEPNEKIDWGNNELFEIENIDGYLIGVALRRGVTLLNKLVFSKYAGGGSVVFNEIPLSTYATTSLNYIIRGKQKFNNRMYFGLGATSTENSGLNTGDYTGVWSVGRNSENEPFSVTFDRKPNDDTLTLRINGFLLVSDYAYISYIQSDGTTYGFSKTIYASTYLTTSVYRTSINPGNMSDVLKFVKKTVKAIGVTYEPLPGSSTARQVSVKYKVDGSDFVTALTKTDDAVVGTKVITETGKDVDGKSFEGGRDIEFQIESKGVTVTGLIYGVETDISLINPKS